MDLLAQYAKFLANGGLIPYALQGLDYLRRAVLGDPPATTGKDTPYTPPFTGGQCYVPYYVTYNVPSSAGGYIIYQAETYIVGRIVGSYKEGNYVGLKTQNSPTGAINQIPFVGNALATGVEITALRKVDGTPDNCGDLPNPNPTPPISGDGLASSPPPDFASAAKVGIVTGTATAADGSAGIITDGEGDFTDAGALAPTDIGGALVKIAAGLAKVLQLLSLINDLIDLLKKLFDKGNKSSFRYDFGNLKKDGLIVLLPDPPPDNVECSFIDLQVTDVKVGFGKEYGDKSPNYYKYDSIGRIEFISSTFGVLSVHEVQFIRTSIPVPPLAYGFFYHFGLDGVNKANCSGFYLKQE